MQTPDGVLAATPSTPLETPMSGKSRSNQSLVVLTSLFLEELRQTPDRAVNIQDAADKIRATKRRIYDITNVLEGIGLIKKPQKNVVQWTQQDIPTNQQQTELQALSQENFRLMAELENLQRQLSRAADSLKALRRNQKSTFVTHEDFLSVLSEAETTVVIRAPKGTLLEVSDAREVHLDSPKAGPIEMFIHFGANELRRVERNPPQEPQPAPPAGSPIPPNMYPAYFGYPNVFSNVPLLSEFSSSFLDS